MISLPKQPKIIKSDSREAVIEIEELYPGYGLTLGNALRRVLLSSCEGAAITSFKIDGAPHEFSTLPGVAEDLIEISLNLKKIRLKIFSEEPQVLSLSAKGEGAIAAKDFGKNPLVEIVNPETGIATLTDKKSNFNLEVRIERGIGYSAAEDRRRKEKLPVGTVELDANFSPVILVNAIVENMRVGEKTNYNRLRLEIKTDGSIDPIFAFNYALGILIDHFSALRTEELAPEGEVASFASLRNSEAIEKIVLENTGLPERILSALKQHRIKTIGDLIKINPEKIKSYKGLGNKAVEEIRAILKEYGIDFK
ncbi:MAG: DNA-directed RNA polymerase subunit alpha [Patescibacteria group bacterium]